jgi:hypothetical protein
LERLVRNRNTAQKIALRLDQVCRRNPEKGLSESKHQAVTGVAIRHFVEIATLFRDNHICVGDWQSACVALSGSAHCAAWLHRISSALLIDGGSALAPGLIVATDTTFSSNRFAWTRQVHKLDYKVELKEIAVYPLHSNQLLKCSHPIRPRAARRFS